MKLVDEINYILEIKRPSFKAWTVKELSALTEEELLDYFLKNQFLQKSKFSMQNNKWVGEDGMLNKRKYNTNNKRLDAELKKREVADFGVLMTKYKKFPR